MVSVVEKSARQTEHTHHCNLLASEKTVIDLTDESRFPWKLFLANVPAVLELLRDEKLHSVKLINQRPTRVTLELAVGGLPPRTHVLALIKDATRHDVKVVVA